MPQNAGKRGASAAALGGKVAGHAGHSARGKKRRRGRK